ncbi:MAG: hypothetical protein ACJAQ4_002378 [Cryomorphaceae bacterium]|jgi:hypothetical protein
MTTNLQFSPSADLLIGNNRYAFRAASNPNFGLLFSLTSTQYQFLNSTAEPIFAINADTGWYASDIRFNAGKGVLVDPNTYALRSEVAPDVGFYFGRSRLRISWFDRCSDDENQFHIWKYGFGGKPHLG